MIEDGATSTYFIKYGDFERGFRVNRLTHTTDMGKNRLFKA